MVALGAVAASAFKVAEGRDGAAWGFMLGGAIGVSISIVVIGLVLVPQAIRVRAVRIANPSAFALGGLTAVGAGDVLRERGFAVGNASGYVAISVDAIGIGVWKGLARIKRVALIPWAQIAAIEVGQITTTRTIPAVVVRLDAADSEVIYGLGVCRRGWLAMFPVLDFARVTNPVGSIRNRRPATST
ncbi:hypothetical protein GCM10009775_17030 [Microbacterium aoyamense]|uniref:Uncharacterized protein n=2 Tax=Microbacterium aoyamense TaxID=344166 RepID=A0ABN2PQM6_9MICO